MAEQSSDKGILHDIKRLMILQLLMGGASQAQIATMLGIGEATMSRMLPKGLAASVRKERS